MTEPNLDGILIDLAVANIDGSYGYDEEAHDKATKAIKALIANQVREAIEQTFIPLSQLYDQYSDECFRLGINDSPQAFFRSEKVKEYLGTTLNGVKK